MSKLAALFGRRTVRIAIFAAILPVLLVLGLQIWWLVKLQRASILAGQAVLGGFLEAVATEILYSYGPAAERVLDVPPDYFKPGRLEKAAAHFRERDVEGVRRLFVARFEHDDRSTVLFYDPQSDSMVAAESGDALRAITVACAPWKLMHANAIRGDAARLTVEERDPANRIVLYPIIDRTSRILGVAGMVLDVEYFHRRLLPIAIRDALEKSFPGDGARRVVVSVRDGEGRVRFSTDPSSDGAPDAKRPFSFVFTDHTLEISSRGLTPAQLARVSFAFNLGLSILAAGLLAGGLVLVLRTAARDIRLSRMKSDFVSNVSHELRTPLASIRVFGEFLRLGRAQTPDKVREYGDYIESESRRLTRLVDNILDFAKIESGGKSYEFENGDVREVLRATLRTFEVRLKHDGFAIDWQAPADPLPPLRIDADALGQAFHNLLDNAVNYSGESRWIGVRLASREGEVVISFEDRGRGISKEEQRKIFDRFHRAGSGLVHDVKGSGLGLSIVRHVVEAHGGRVTVRSEPGRGSVFAIHLPLVADSPPAATSDTMATPDDARPDDRRGRER